MNRIDEKLNSLKQKGKKAVITYTTAGLPDMATTKKVILAQEEAGIDIMEVGIPFSDPIADGPVIQAASYEAIKNGANVKKAFAMMEELRNEGLKSPVVFMLYYNTIFHYGIEKFVEKCVDCGVDGLIIPDLPMEEQGDLKQVIANVENAPELIQLVSPVSKHRIKDIVKDAKGFVYCVSQMGVTGGNADFHKDIRNYLSEVKNASPVPVMMGFGIRTAADVLPLSDIIDGAIVGSHFIKILMATDYSTDAVKEYVSTFKKELN